MAYDNGARQQQATTGGGPCGIWTYNSNNITIQYNESYGNLGDRVDGDGFDMDGGTTNCILQYNYSHDNDGAGYLQAQFPDAQEHSGDIIRYNISQNDGRKNSYGAIEVSASKRQRHD